MGGGGYFPKAYPRGIRGVRGKGNVHPITNNTRTRICPRSTRRVTEELEERGNLHLITNDIRTRIFPKRTRGVTEKEEKGANFPSTFLFLIESFLYI